jgi:hypothetical protein
MKADAERRGQSHTVWVVRAIERALSKGTPESE